MTKTKEIHLTPDYGNIMRTMLRELAIQGNTEHLETAIAGASALDTLKAFQRITWPIAVAANSIATTEHLEQFRAAVADLNKNLVEHIQRLEAKDERQGEIDWSKDYGFDCGVKERR